MAFKIVEKYPDGRGSFRYLFDRFDTNLKKSSDLLDLWNVLEPEIRDTMKYVFSEANPTGWSALETSYVRWKAKHGYFTTVGVMTGALRSAVSDRAIVKKRKKEMVYTYNPDVIQRLTHTSRSSRSRKVGDYIGHFNSKRPVFKWARIYLTDHIKRVLDAYVMSTWRNTPGNEK